jgi:hypothetical protein
VASCCNPILPSPGFAPFWRNQRISCYVNQVEPPEVHDSALKREYTKDDIHHALKHVHISYDVIDDDPPRTWVFGFTPKGILVEMIVLHKATEHLVIHCMKARKAELDKALRITGGRR